MAVVLMYLKVPYLHTAIAIVAILALVYFAFGKFLGVKLPVGTVIKADTFEKGDHVDVTGTSKGKGFEGNIKRWNQSRGRKTHGSHSYRVAGSLGACTYPGEVFRTKRLPGHMGSETITVQNLEVARVDAARNLLLIKGAIPGAKGSMVTVKSTVK